MLPIVPSNSHAEFQDQFVSLLFSLARKTWQTAIQFWGLDLSLTDGVLEKTPNIGSSTAAASLNILRAINQAQKAARFPSSSGSIRGSSWTVTLDWAGGPSTRTGSPLPVTDPCPHPGQAAL